MATTAQSEVNRIRVDINATQGNIAAFQERAANTSLTQLQRTVAQSNLVKAQAQLVSLEAELVKAEATLAIEAAAPVVPPPPKTAGQTVLDDAADGPSKPPALEVDQLTGRIKPAGSASTAPSNADQVETLATGDTDVNTNGPIKTFVQTQVTNGPTSGPPNPEVYYGKPDQRGSTAGNGDDQGNQSSAINDPNSRYPNTTVDEGLKNGDLLPNPGSIIRAQVPQPTLPPAGGGGDQSPVAAGVGISDDYPAPGANTTATETQNAYNDSQPIRPQANVLDQFGSYTYSVSVYLMNPDQYKAMVQSKVKNVIGYNLLIQSAGAPVGASNTPTNLIGSPTIPTSGRSPYFNQDFYIESLSLETIVAGKGTRLAHNAAGFKMTIIEPGGITFLDRLYAAVQDFVPKNGAGAINYTAVQYLLAIRWYGWDLNGQLIKGVGGTQLSDPNAAIEKFIPFRIKDIKWGVSNKLVTYDLDCAAINSNIGFSTGRGTVPYNVELSDGTVKGLLSGDAQFATNPDGTNATSTTTAPPAPNKANAARSTKATIRQGLMGAMNDFQKKLVEDGIYEVADEYEIIFANGSEVIANASVVKPENIVKNLSATPMAPPSTKNAAGIDPRKTSVDNSVRNFTITAGQQINQVLDLVIRNSTFISDQARVVSQEEPEVVTDEVGNVIDQAKNKQAVATILWYNITTNTVPIQYDKKRNDYAYKITYIVSTYVAPNFDSKYFPVPKFNGLHKSYKYWWTGENVSVLDYQVSFNHLYNQTISGTEPGNSATDKLRQQRSASMRDQPKYVYQATSTESSAGAEGKANEMAANAAEYLYSPTDLGETKLRIVGDPAWIGQGSMAEGVNPANFNYGGFLPDGTINYDSQQVLFEIAWQRPQDYDLNTGLADPYANVNGAREPIQSNVYQLKKCISEFKQGKFEQTLEGTLYTWPIPNGQNTPATKPTNVNVNSSGQTERTADADPSKPADLQTPGTGTVPAPSSASAVNLQNTTNSDNNGARNQELAPLQSSAPESNGTDVGVNSFATPPVIGQVYTTQVMPTDWLIDIEA